MANATTGHADHHTTATHAGSRLPIPHLGRLIDQLIERGPHIVRKLDLGNGPQALCGGADRKANDALLRQRRVEDAQRAEVGGQAGRAPEHAAERDVLAEEQRGVVGGQRVPQRAVDGLVQRLPRGFGVAPHRV